MSKTNRTPRPAYIVSFRLPLYCLRAANIIKSDDADIDLRYTPEDVMQTTSSLLLLLGKITSPGQYFSRPDKECFLFVTKQNLRAL